MIWHGRATRPLGLGTDSSFIFSFTQYWFILILAMKRFGVKFSEDQRGSMARIINIYKTLKG